MAIKIALAGNPNCGKTTLFNNLTGSNQYVGNWPGVTVEKKEGRLKGHKDVIVQDLPGIYSLSPYTLEEVVTRDYLVKERPDAILNIIDGTNIERNLYLTTQLIELGIPVVLAVNMMDIVRKNGDKIDLKKLGDALGCQVVEMSAIKGEGCLAAAKLAIEVAKKAQKEGTRFDKLPRVFEGNVEHAIAHLEEVIENIVDPNFYRWYAIKLFERDDKIADELKLEKKIMDHISKHIEDCEKAEDDEGESIITNQRYMYIANVVDGAITRKNARHEMTLSDKIDSIVTNRILALPIFAAVMVFVYWISVSWLGTIVTDFTNEVVVGEWAQGGMTNFLESVGASDGVISLVVDGIIGGLGAPLGFVPQIALMFLLLSLLEDCGYMARVAFIMDRIFRRFGLSGKSFIPMLISSGCGVPAIMATRTIENLKDRRMTMITTTMIPCGAKLPVIALFAGAILGSPWYVAPAMYFIGITAVILACIMLKKFKMFAGDPAPFVMELPQYHMPSAKGVLIHTWDRVWAFIKKIGTILFLCVATMWFLSSYGFENGSFGQVDPEFSLMASLGGLLLPIFVPIGITSWQAVAAAISGFVAKEGIVTTIGVLVGLGTEASETDPSLWTSTMALFPSVLAAVVFLIFNLLDSPCLAAISTMSKEIGGTKWTWFAIIFQNVYAYCVCLMIYQLGGYATGYVSFNTWTVVAAAVFVGFVYLLFRRKPEDGDLKPAMAQ